MKRWTLYQPEVPCSPDGCCKHYACYLFEMGWRVSLRKFWFIKWLEFTTPTPKGLDKK